MLRLCFVWMLLLLPFAAHSAGLFTDEERAKIMTFWNAPERYRTGLPADAAQKGVWQMRLTPEGSLWLWKYQNAIGAAKAPPTQDPTAAATPATGGWREWVQARVAYDRWQAQQTANTANLALSIHSDTVSLPSRVSRRDRNQADDPLKSAVPPALPGPIPPSLLAAVGNPPRFASAVTPLQHVITFEAGEVYSYVDNTAMSPTYAYYRFPQGVATAGKALSDAELSALFASSGFTPSEQRIMMSVSKLEGSFEAINTYDTGYVSIGFIQFITLDDGKHSLSAVLAQEKTDQPAEFEKDFRRFGIDLTPDGTIAVVDPVTGAELIGPEAVKKLIEDKRLIAVFQKAGRNSVAFRIAQLRVARSQYWPGDDPLAVTINGQTLTCKVCDVIHSEAGLATLFDRKVNRGNIGPVAEQIAKIMAARNLTTLAQICDCEREIIAALKYRADYLNDKTLSQPKQAGQTRSADP